MSETSLTNGEKPSSSSQFLDHLTTYPLVIDSISTYKSNPYGQKSISIANTAYDRFGKPVIPYLKGPYSYVAPYVAKADSLGDQGLGKLEGTFPIVKQDTDKVKDTVLDYALLPVKLAVQGKDYVFQTYGDEYQKSGGNGVVTTAKAIMSTELKLASDVYQFVSKYLGPKKEAAKKKGSEALNN